MKELQSVIDISQETNDPSVLRQLLASVVNLAEKRHKIIEQQNQMIAALQSYLKAIDGED